MSNLEKYKKVFMETFHLKDDEVKDELEYNTISEWDSIGHMSMISELEDIFDISIQTDDILNFGTFKKGKEILAKYGIEIV